MRPPKCSTIWRLMGKPSPVPCGRWSASPPWRNFSKIRARCACGHAGAVVLHLHGGAGVVDPQPQHDAACPARARTWPRWTAGSAAPASAGRRRRAAAATAGGNLQFQHGAPLAQHLAARSAPPAAAARRRSTSVLCHSAWPDSILAMSSTWLTRRLSRSVSATTMPRNCWRCAASISASSTISSASARMLVSGVRSSCVTLRHEVVLQPVQALELLVGGAQLVGWPSPAPANRRAAARPRPGCASRRPCPALLPRTTEATITRADALPMAPGELRSRRTAPGARRRSMPRRHRRRASRIVGEQRRARSAPRKRPASASRSATWARPRQNTGRSSRVRSKTSTKSSAWLASRADGVRSSDTPTYSPALASRLQNSECVRLSSPHQAEQAPRA